MKKTYKMSPAGRKAISRAQKARWVRLRAERVDTRVAAERANAEVTEAPLSPWPSVILPTTASKAATTDADVKAFMLRVAKARAERLVDLQFGEAAAGGQPRNALLLAPVALDAGHCVEFGDRVAANERYHVLDIVRAHLKRLNAVRDVLVGYGALLRSCKMPVEADELDFILRGVVALANDIDKSVVDQRGPLAASYQIRYDAGSTEWSLAE